MALNAFAACAALLRRLPHLDYARCWRYHSSRMRAARASVCALRRHASGIACARRKMKPRVWRQHRMAPHYGALLRISSAS
jgi:hypothetical protein